MATRTQQTMLVWLICCSSLILSRAAVGQAYRIVDLGVFTPTGISNIQYTLDQSGNLMSTGYGSVVGYQNTGGVTQTAIWTLGVLTPIGSLGGSQYSSYGYGINSSGFVCGQTQNSVGTSVGYFWNTPPPTFHFISGGELTSGNGINEGNDIAGRYYNHSGNGALYVYAVAWLSNSGSIPGFSPGEIVTPCGNGTDGAISGANAINNNRHIVGVVAPTGTSNNYAFLYLGPNSLLYIRLPGDTAALARSVTDNDQVVGQSTNPATGSIRGFYFNLNEGGRSSTMALPALPGGTNSSAFSISNVTAQGTPLTIVGYAQRMNSDNTVSNHAALWRRNPVGVWVVTDLNDLLPQNSGWSNLTVATGINAQNQIVGTGTYNGQTHGFLMLPPQALLVHGIWSGPEIWNTMAANLGNNGYVTDAIDFNKTANTQMSPHGGPSEAKIELQAMDVAAEITKLITDPYGHVDTTQAVDVVCHSMGGLAVRWYLENPSLWPVDSMTGLSGSCVRKLITLGTPHWGTDIVLADPVGGIVGARFLAPDNSRNVDTVDDWSDALNEMYAEWMPPPAPLFAAPPDGYPNQGWMLAQWPYDLFAYESPISNLSLAAAEGLLKYGSGLLSPGTTMAVEEAYFRFANPDGRLFAHGSYYNQYVNPLGTVLWAPSPTVYTVGIDERYVSTFLYNLNGVLIDTSGAKEYVVAGDKSSFFGLIKGPWNIANDGVVPTQSALGVDPLTLLSVFPNIVTSSGQPLSYSYNHVVVPLNHSDYYLNAQVLHQVIDWLLANE